MQFNTSRDQTSTPSDKNTHLKGNIYMNNFLKDLLHVYVAFTITEYRVFSYWHQIFSLYVSWITVLWK